MVEDFKPMLEPVKLEPIKPEPVAGDAAASPRPIVPGFGGLVRLAVLVWLLVAGIIAIRQALDFSTGKAVLTAVLGWLVMALLSTALLAPSLGAC